MATTNPGQIYNKAKTLFQQQRYAEALGVLERAGNGKDADCLYARVRCLTKLGRLDEARRDCENLRDVLKDPRWKKLSDKLDAIEARKAGAVSDGASAVSTRKPAAAPKAKRGARSTWIISGIVLAAAIILAGGVIAAHILFGSSGDASLIDKTSLPEEVAAPAQKEAPETEKPFAPRLSLTPRLSGEKLRLHGLDAYDASPTSADADPLSGDDDVLPGPLGGQSSDDLPPASGNAGHREGRLGLSVPLQAGSSEKDGAGVATPSTGQTGQTSRYPAQSLPFTPVDSVMGLQPFKTAQRVANARGDEITLTNANPSVGSWYILEVNAGGLKNTLHLEVASLHGDPVSKPKLTLYRDGLTVAVDGEQARAFPFWASANAPQPGAAAAPNDGSQLNPEPSLAEILKPNHAFESPLTAICGGFVYIRSQKPGSATKLEITTDLLRETRLGDWLVAYAKPYLIAKPELGEDHRAAASAAHAPGETYPLDARVEESQVDLYLAPPNLGIPTDAADNRHYYGRWYKAVNHPFVFVSMMKPTIVEKKIMDAYTDRVGAIGSHDKGRREADALVYLIAFDLSKFRLGYGLGAGHPRLDWSPRAEQTTKGAKGPDGFDSKSPFCSVGAVPPYYAPWVAGTFIGGFKREHGSFKTGPLSRINNGSHFGFMEQGVVFSRLLPGIATAAISRDGGLSLFTWPEDGTGLMPQLTHARQNCVSIVEGVDQNGISIPNALVNEWGAGSWSGDQNGNVVTLRAGIAVQEYKGSRFLLFAYFTGATPNAMARVFQAYQCRYGMLLDMNTPNYCYAALYNRDAEGKVSGAEYLHKDMASGNGNDGSLKFLQKNDTRDFFYVLRNY